MKKIIPIMHCFNDNYVIPAGVAFYSMLENASKEYNYNLYVLHSDIKKENQELLEKTVKMFPNATLEFIDMDNKFDNLFNKTKFKEHFSKEIYYKFIVSSIFPQYEKIIVGDVDVIYLSDVSKNYFELDVEEDFYVLGQNYTVWKKKEVIDKWYKNFSEAEKEKFTLSAGYMVYNLKKMRENNIETKLIECAIKNIRNLPMPEQDVINLVCFPKIKYFQGHTMLCAYHYDLISHEDRNQVVQLHYATSKKPWKNNCAYANLWFEYLLKTPCFERYMRILEEKFNPKTKTIFSFSLPFYKKKFSFIKSPKI